MKKKTGFTLAEILITLAIIGIVAAITLPSLLVNVNEKAWDAQKKALHARLAQAIGQMNTLGGYGSYVVGEGGTATTDTAAESFILDALSKVYKINNVCGPDKLSSCGLPASITTLNNSTMTFPTKMSELNAKLLQNVGTIGSSDGSNVDTKAAAFETVNGESIAVFYNPHCGSDSSVAHYAQNKMCVNFLYDLNGAEGPNQVGKDVGYITALYRKNPVVVAPIAYKADSTSAPSYTASTSTLDAASSCRAQSEDLRLPDKSELAAMFINSSLINLTTGSYGSGSVTSVGANGMSWTQDFATGQLSLVARSTSNAIRCIQK